MTVETSGYFAGPALSNDPRWKQGPIYVFGINAETGTTAFSGSESSFAVSGRFPELLFDGRDAVEAASIFGEGFWYYNSDNPATQQEEPKVAFVKLVRAEGVPLLVGSGHRPVLRRYRPERMGNLSLHFSLPDGRSTRYDRQDFVAFACRARRTVQVRLRAPSGSRLFLTVLSPTSPRHVVRNAG